MKIPTRYLVPFIALCASVAHAASPIASPSFSRLLAGGFVSIEGSAIWPDLSHGITVNNGSPYPAPYNVDQLSIHNDTGSAFGLLAGYKWHRQSTQLPGFSLALRYQRVFAKNINGTITQYSMPEFTNYNYAWKLRSNYVSAFSKLDLYQFGPLTPFVDLGLGVAVSRSSNFSETALPGVTPRYSPAFGNHNQSNFAYNVGAGLEYSVTPNLAVSLRYDYLNLGAISSGNGVTTWSAERLNLGKYKANTATLGLTYYFDKPGLDK